MMSTRRMLFAAWVPLLMLVFPAVALADDVTAGSVTIEPGTAALSVKVSWTESGTAGQDEFEIQLRPVTSRSAQDWMSAGSAFATTDVSGTATGEEEITMAGSKALVYATTYEARVSFVETTRTWVSSEGHATKSRSQPKKPAVPAMPKGVRHASPSRGSTGGAVVSGERSTDRRECRASPFRARDAASRKPC